MISRCAAFCGLHPAQKDEPVCRFLRQIRENIYLIYTTNENISQVFSRESVNFKDGDRGKRRCPGKIISAAPNLINIHHNKGDVGYARGRNNH
jgi:hypothetical protein